MAVVDVLRVRGAVRANRVGPRRGLGRRDHGRGILHGGARFRGTRRHGHARGAVPDRRSSCWQNHRFIGCGVPGSFAAARARLPLCHDGRPDDAAGAAVPGRPAACDRARSRWRRRSPVLPGGAVGWIRGSDEVQCCGYRRCDGRGADRHPLAIA